MDLKQTKKTVPFLDAFLSHCFAGSCAAVISACWLSVLASEIPIPLCYCYSAGAPEIYLTSGKMSTHCNHVTLFPDLQFISQLG